MQSHFVLSKICKACGHCHVGYSCQGAMNARKTAREWLRHSYFGPGNRQGCKQSGTGESWAASKQGKAKE